MRIYRCTLLDSTSPVPRSAGRVSPPTPWAALFDRVEADRQGGPSRYGRIARRSGYDPASTISMAAPSKGARFEIACHLHTARLWTWQPAWDVEIAEVPEMA